MNIVTELHLLIDWTCYFSDVENRIASPLQIIKKIPMEKLEQKTEIISKFYDVPVDDFRGSTDFNVYLIKDTNPVYDYRETSKGNHKVNVHLFDLKKSLRQIMGGYKIHATDNIQETKDNLKVLGLFNENYKEKKFDTLKDVFDELNRHPQLKWIITHNFDNFVDGDDIDFLTDDYFYFMRLLDANEKPKGGKFNSVSDGGNSVRNYIKVGKKNIPIDIRYLGDNFYDKKLRGNLLKRDGLRADTLGEQSPPSPARRGSHAHTVLKKTRHTSGSECYAEGRHNRYQVRRRIRDTFHQPPLPRC